MVRKLTLPIKIIMIGLSPLLIVSCVVLEMDPPDKFYLDNYLNRTGSILTLTLENAESQVVNTIEIPIGQEVSLISNSGFNGGEKPILNYVDALENTGNTKIKLYVDTNLKVEWKMPISDIPENINSPFNYNSWKLELFESPINNDVVGKIVFTISDEDIE